MSKKNIKLSILEKLAKVESERKTREAKYEAQKQKIIEKRRSEILRIIEKSGAIQIDDNLLKSTLLFLMDEKNKNHLIREEIMSYSTKMKNKKTDK